MHARRLPTSPTIGAEAMTAVAIFWLAAAVFVLANSVKNAGELIAAAIRGRKP
jgi:hypothetical protein